MRTDRVDAVGVSSGTEIPGAPRFGDAKDDLHSRDADASACAEDATSVAQSELAQDDPGHEESESSDPALATTSIRPSRWKRSVIYGVLPTLAFILAAAAGILKFQDATSRDADVARAESLQVARDSTVALLSYRPDTVEKDLAAAANDLTGDFKNSYTSLTNDVVIPGAIQKLITATARVAGAASVSATTNRAVNIVFVDQTITVGTSAPTDSASAVRVTLDRIGDRWLISGFDPV